MNRSSNQPTADQLTQRERDILRLITDGLSNQDIAERLFITLSTVKWYLKQIYSKLDVSSRTQAIAAARSSGLLDNGLAKIESSALLHNLPYQPTSFIGRDKELAAIARRLEDPGCRLLTVVGPGGIGKSRLALHAAEQQIAAFAQGVYFVPLAPLSTPESIILALAEAVGFSFNQGSESKQQLLDYLRAKHMLLLLDNFEHLLVGADLVAAVLEAAPGVKILATSRERLNLQAEMVFPLDGMAYPQDGSTADATDYSAVKLFLQSATHVQPDFPVTAQNLTAVAHICRLVQGMPLGILLAAAWVAVLSVQEIAQEIQRSLNFLETDQRDLPERQRSLQAAFDHSWKLLTEGEREVFKRLSVFRGSFTREAAQYVAGTSLKTLMALVNKSLLRRDAATGRYDIHELLRQYGEVQLNALPQESEHIRNLHGTYYADYMRQQSNALRSLREGAVLDEIALEFNNVLEGWNYAVEKRRSDIFRGMAYGLWRFYDLRLSHPEAASLFGRAAEALQAGLPEKELETALGLMLVHQGYFIASNPKLALQGKAITEKGLTRLLMYDCSEEIVMALLHLARVNTMFLGQVSAGKQAAQDALDIARKIDFQSGIASSLVHLGYAAWSEGDWTRAVQLGEECLRVAEGVGELRLMAASAVMVLGAAAIELHDYRQAERQFDQGLRWFKELADPWGIAVSYSRLGKVALMSQDYERSNYWFHESLGYHKQSGQRSRQYYETLYDVSRLYAALGRKGNAVKFLSLVAFEARDSYTGGLATAALDDLRTILSAEDFAVACERGKVLDLDAVVQELLQDI